jgi:phosphoribosylformylglycinamidine cyclo-ligase
MMTYKKAGVDIEKGDRFAGFIKNIKSNAIGKGIGGFAGGLELDLTGYTKPVLLSCTDGVGTKLLVAKKLKDYSTVGIDLVAMNVNDLIVCGAKPLLFLDYIACGRIDENILHEVISGIVKGCEIAGASLAGGETAEMPDMYGEDDIDLAGFAVGIVEKSRMLPRINQIQEGDAILGLASAGIHSNGLSLARKVIPEYDLAAWKELLTPTRIYTREFDLLMKMDAILAAAHITGGGLYGNLIRVVPEHLQIHLYRNWPVPAIFSEIKKNGNIDDEEMNRVFNMGIGIALIAKSDNIEKLTGLMKENGFSLLHIGELRKK